MSTTTLPTDDFPALAGWQRMAFVAGFIGLAVCLLGALLPGTRLYFFRGWLVAFNVFTGIAVGGLVILMLQYLTGGDWGFVLRRPLEAATRTLPLLAVLFIPLLFGMNYVYSWARPEVVAESPNLQHKAAYLNFWFFVARTVVYFAIWSGLGLTLSAWSKKQDATRDVNVLHRCESLSAPGMVLYVLTVTFASIDWVMSLEPEWYSTIYGAMFGMGQVLSAFTFAIAILMIIGTHPSLEKALTTQNLRDMGSLMMAFVMVWAYLSLSQFLLIWAGNLPEEIPWYMKRGEGVWRYFAILLVLLHFVLPFVLLLNSSIKTQRQSLLRVAILVLVMRVVDLVWLIVPAFEHDTYGSENSIPVLAPVLYIAGLVGLGGLWFGYFCYQLRQMPLLPVAMNQVEGTHHG